MASIRQLREELQAPRRPYDTLYGRSVMRFFSIYLTYLFSRFKTPPSFVTFLSILLGLAGAYWLASGHLIVGVLLINGWYLLDHVDGELARLYKATSATGLYFDTIANALILPATYTALGIYTSQLWVGLAASYGALMLLVLSYCESAVLMQCRSQKMDKQASSDLPGSRKGSSAAGRIFGLVHTLASFPQFLLLLTVFLFLPEQMTSYLLVLYAFLLNFVWFVVLTQTLLSKKLDKRSGEI